MVAMLLAVLDKGSHLSLLAASEVLTVLPACSLLMPALLCMLWPSLPVLLSVQLAVPASRLVLSQSP